MILDEFLFLGWHLLSFLRLDVRNMSTTILSCVAVMSSKLRSSKLVSNLQLQAACHKFHEKIAQNNNTRILLWVGG